MSLFLVEQAAVNPLVFNIPRLVKRHYEQNRKKEQAQKLTLPLILVAFLALIFLSTATGLEQHATQWKLWAPLLLIKLAGVGISTLLILEKFGQKSPFLQKVCGMSTQTSCEEVTESPAGTLFGWLSMAEAGLFYFAGGALSLAFALGSADLQLTLILLSLFNLPTLL